MNKNKSIYYNINETLSHNCMFNFVISNRAAGKTYGWLKRSVKQFIKYGHQFIYLRRFESELKQDEIDNFFQPLIKNGEFKNYELSVKGKTLYCNKKICGYIMSLTKASGKRGISFPNVTNLLFDEFMIYDYPVHHYLKNEVNTFMDFYNTIDRFEDRVKVFFFANAETTNNIYLKKFGLKLQKGQKLCKKKNLVLLQLFTNEEMKEKQRVSKFGQLAKITGYDKMAIDNEFIKENYDFVEKKSCYAKFQFSFLFYGEMFGVWVSYNEGKMWVSHDYDKFHNVCYALTTEDMKPNTLVMTKLKRSQNFMMLIENFQLGNVYFESLSIKTTVVDLIKQYV